MTEPSQEIRLDTPVQFLPGVGPSRATMLNRLGLYTAADLLFFFPRDYDDMSDVRAIDALEPDLLQSVIGTVQESEIRSGRPGRSVVGILIQGDCGGHLRAVFFNQPFVRDRFRRGDRVVVSGKPKQQGLVWQMAHPRITPLGEDESKPPGEVMPIYPLTEGLKQYQVRRIIKPILETHVELLDEVFPQEYLEAHDLWPIHKALSQVHFPDNMESLAHARRRFIYQELFILQLAVTLRRAQIRADSQAIPLPGSAKIDARIRRLFPFELTDGQREAIDQIARDMGQSVPMNRLLQGDVGSGKTIVAVYAMLTAVAHGAQAVLMAPTEVLARQHVSTLRRTLSHSHVRIARLTGGMSTVERRELLEKLAAGEIDILIGTQALLQNDVKFARLGLVVIDEQHKFGVEQRAALRAAGTHPHYLVMTATPIPRTVTITLFGDLDLSIIRDMPPGRKQVHTYLAEEDQREKWWDFLRRKLDEGRQGYVVTPLVEESETLDVTSLQEAYEELVNGPLADYRVGLIHGRMSNQEKDAIMLDFTSGEIQVLVCTSVVEVGIDVSNATLMTIESAQRFGLAQLHQLRGRISRGTHPGFCTIFADAKTDESIERLKAFTQSTDGFELAEIDFKLRGPGELFGTSQHGLPPFRIADLSRDRELLEEARADAARLIDTDPGMAAEAHARLRRMVITRYGKVLDLGDVG
ncbi:MAG: ATP-dependent DNA helicase RecG [Planctomycetia bacterium]|jgi:ATP-dependent DNA helicase RecG